MAEHAVAADGLVAFEGPLDIPATLEPLRRHDDLIDRWDGAVLRRSVRRDGHALAYAAVPAGGVDTPALHVEVENGADLYAGRAAAAEALITAPGALTRLAARDPVIAVLHMRHRGVGMVRHPDLFIALLRAISAQQVNLRWAATVRARLATAFGSRHVVGGGEVRSLDPARIAGLSVAEVRAMQLTTRKAESLIEVAEAVASGRLDGAALSELPDAAVVARLSELRGIGRWSAEWVLARTLARPVCVAGDLGVRKVVAQAYLGVPIAGEEKVRGVTAHWGGAASAAQWLLLHAAACGDDLMALGVRVREGDVAVPEGVRRGVWWDRPL